MTLKLCFNVFQKKFCSNKSYFNYKNNNLKNNNFVNKLTVIDIFNKSAIGKLNNNSKIISSTKLNHKLCVSFGDTLEMTKKFNSNGN